MNEALCSFLAWDTEFFGHRIYRVNVSRLREELIERLFEECRGLGVECLYFLADADDARTLQLAGEFDFRLVDIRVTLTRSVDDTSILTSSNPIRTARREDIPELQQIAAEVHANTRFFADPGFSAKAPSLYQTWISESVRGEADVVLVAELDGRPVGYLSGHLENGQEGRIGLVGMGPSARGRGLGKALVDSGLSWFCGRGVRQVQVVTQGRNVAAQRLYQCCGFLTSGVQLWFHRWFSLSNDEKP